MLIEEYFEFLADDDIRVKGTRVGIESILYEYIYQQRSPEEILKTFLHFDPRSNLCDNPVLFEQ